MDDQTPFPTEQERIASDIDDFDRRARAVFSWIARHWFFLLTWAVIFVALWMLWRAVGAMALVLLTMLYVLHYKTRAHPFWAALNEWIASLRAAVWDAIFARLFAKAHDGDAMPYANPYQQRAHETAARDTESELDRLALFSAANDDAAAVFVSQTRAAMEKRLNDLLLIPQLTTAQQQERTALERWITEDRARSNELAGFTAQPSALSASPHGLLSGAARAALQPWHLWIVGGLVALNGVQFAAGAVQGRNLDAAKARADRNQAVAVEWRDRAAQFEDAYTRQTEMLAQINAARMQDQRTSRALIEDQQRRQVRAQNRERARREAEIRSIDAPPDWGGLLRDVAGDQSAGSAAGDSGGGSAAAADHPPG